MTTTEALKVARLPVMVLGEANQTVISTLLAAVGQLAREVEAYHRYYGPNLPLDPVDDAMRRARRYVDEKMMSSDKSAVVMTLVAELERLRG